MQNIVTLGEINDTLKFTAVTAAQLADMGFAPLDNKPICEALPIEESRRLRNAKLYPAESIGQIRVALAKRLAAPASCLLQIQEPAPATAQDALREAEAALEVAMARILKANPGHSISATSEAKALVAVRAALAAPAAVAVPDERAALQKIIDACEQIPDGLEGYLEPLSNAIAEARAALAATPAAPEGPAEGDPASLLQLADLLESGRHLIQVERKEVANALRTLAATTAAAPWLTKPPLTADEARQAVRTARLINGPSDTTQPHEYAMAGALALAAKIAATPPDHIADAGKMIEADAQLSRAEAAITIRNLKRENSELATQLATLPAAAPVVLPEPAHWLAVLDPEQVPHQLKTSLHAVGFRDKKAAEAFIAEKLDFDGWKYTLESLHTEQQVRALLGNDAPAGTGGWKIHAENLERERNYWRDRAKTMREHQEGECWYWQGDGNDNPESMVNSLAVVIRADALRELLATGGQAQAWLRNEETGTGKASLDPLFVLGSTNPTPGINGATYRPLFDRSQAQADARDADGEAFRTAARLGLTLRFYGNCAQSGAPGTPSVYEVTTGPDSAEAMRASIERAAIAIAAAKKGSEA